MSKTSSSHSHETDGKFAPATTTWDAQANFTDLASAGRENLDAMVKASTILAQGYGAIGQLWMDFLKSTLGHGIEATHAVMSSKNPKDALEVQATYARAAFEGYVKEASKISELSVKTTTDAIAPIQKRVDEVVGKYSRAA